MGDPQASTSLNLLVTSGAPDGPEGQSVAVYVAGVDQRVAVILRGGRSEGIAPPPGSVSLQFGTDEKHWGAPVVPDIHTDTAATLATDLTTTYRFPKPGAYWTDMTAKDNAPAIKASHLQSEPVLFLADATGVVTARIDGLYGKEEAAAGLAHLTGS